jgi:hypothetical protein
MREKGKMGNETNEKIDEETVKTVQELEQESKEEKNALNTPVGTAEQPKLSAGKVRVDSVSAEDVLNKETQKKVGTKIVCLCKHREKEELISISSIKHTKGDKIKEEGLWFNRDKDENIVKTSPLAQLMKKHNIDTPTQLSGKELETVEGKSGYLCFKAY